MKVHAVQTGTVAVKIRQRAGRGKGQLRLPYTLLDREWTEPLPVYAWVVEHPEGVLVVDSGETARTAEPGYFPRWHPYYRLGVKLWVRPEEEIGPRLEELGISPGDVRWLVLTHLHTDHAGGIYHFPESEILVSRRELEAAAGFRGKLRGYLPQHWPDWLSPRLVDFPNEPFGPFPESLPLTEAGDVRLVSTPGHSVGHMSVVLDDGEQCLFFAGDTSYTERLMLDQVLDGVSPDLAAAARTLERVKRFVAERAVVYLPSHDPDSAARLASRRPAPAAVATGGRGSTGR